MLSPYKLKERLPLLFSKLKSSFVKVCGEDLPDKQPFKRQTAIPQSSALLTRTENSPCLLGQIIPAKDNTHQNTYGYLFLVNVHQKAASYLNFRP